MTYTLRPYQQAAVDAKRLFPIEDATPFHACTGRDPAPPVLFNLIRKSGINQSQRRERP